MKPVVIHSYALTTYNPEKQEITLSINVEEILRKRDLLFESNYSVSELVIEVNDPMTFTLFGIPVKITYGGD